MKRPSQILMVLLLIVGISAQSTSQVANTSSDINSKAVWDVPEEAWGKMRDECGGEVECVLRLMSQFGASPKAIEFTRLLEGDGFMSSFREMGKVDFAEVISPFWMNANQRFKLVNGKFRVIDVEGSFGENIEGEIRNNPKYPMLVRRYPNLTLGGYPQFVKMEHLSTGGQRLIFKFDLVDGCRACSTDSDAYLAYDFDRAGDFLGTKLVRMSKKQPPPALAQTSSSISAQANKAWPTYWRQFSNALKRKDRIALKRLMTSESEFFSGGGDETRDGWITMIGWKRLQTVLVIGTMPFDEGQNPGRITKDRGLIFEFVRGKWRFTGVMGD